jgi:hypothetical protein
MSWDWDDIGRIGAAIATGGVSEVARAVSENEAEKRRREEAARQRAAAQAAAAFGAQGPAPQAPGSPRDGAQTPSAVCCNRYAIEPPFLLDTQNGRIWRFDDTKKQFLIVPKESTALEKSWETLLRAKLTAEAVDGLNDAANTATRAEHLRVAQLVDAHIKLMDDHLRNF